MTLHDTGVALALAGGGDVYKFASLEGFVDLDLLANFVGGHVAEAELEQLLARLDASLGKVSGRWLGQCVGLLGAVGDLNCVIAIAGRSLYTDNTHRTDAQHCDRNDFAVLIPKLRHADFFADYRFLWSSHIPVASSRERSARAGPAERMSLMGPSSSHYQGA